MRHSGRSEGAIGWIVLSVLTVLIILPLGTVLLQVVKPGLLGESAKDTGASLLLEVFTRPLWSRALKNSLLLGLCTTFFGTIFGALLANLRIKWEFKAGKLLDIAAWILMIMPSFIIAQGWVYFASGNGVARAWLGWDGISSLVFSFPGLVFIMVLNKFPFAYVTIKSALEWKPKRLSYAARVNGATAWEEWKTVQAPLCIPAYCSAAILIFMDTIGDFGLPSAISGVYRFQTLPYAIYQALYSSPIRFDMAGVLSFYLVLIIIAAMVLQYLIMGRKRFDFMDTGTVQAVPERPPRAAGILLNITGTFLAFFIFIGNLGNIEEFRNFLVSILSGHEELVSVLTSQVISNVPAALLLSGFTSNWQALIVGCNLGGLGTLIASMASLISFRFVCKEGNMGRFLLVFTAVNVAFLGCGLALCALLGGF